MGNIPPLVARAAEGTASTCFAHELGASCSGSVMVSFHVLTGFIWTSSILCNKPCGRSQDTMINETGVNWGHTKHTGTDSSWRPQQMQQDRMFMGLS